LIQRGFKTSRKNPTVNISDLFNKKNMSIQISNLAQSDLLQDLNTADSSAVVGGTYAVSAPIASISVPSIPSYTPAAPGTTTGIGVTSYVGAPGAATTTGVGFGSATGGGFTAASGSSASGPGGSIASGGGLTGGVANPINVTFDRV
jgi:hypothetical protein